ncbi:MAG TPA: FAD-dependent oxidoreductase [Kofleriaceae bacterium]|nr:FAD-dependent oxidoreductase [Kofleriaceae bacterium]
MDESGTAMDGGVTRSVWLGVDLPDYERDLRRDVRCHVCVIGAGMTGLSVAYELARTGRRVVVIDDGPIAGGESARTSAHLASVLDTRYHELERLLGVDRARLAADSHRAAIDRIEAIAAEEGIACELQRIEGYLFASGGGYRRGELGELEQERDACRRAGFTGVDVLGQVPLAGLALGPALRVPRQGQLQPLRYLAGLVRAIERRGGRVISCTRATEVHDGAPALVVTASGATIRADAVVVATHTPFNDRVAVHTKLAGYRSYVIGLAVRRGALPPMLLWDTEDPYHYVRLARPDLVIVGGEDHKVGQEDEPSYRFERLERWARRCFPILGARSVAWSGQVMESVDGLGYIGVNPRQRNVYVATGYGGNGLTHAAIAGMLIADLIRDRPNPWAALYSPRRRTLRATPQWLRENLNAAAQYRDWLTPGEQDAVASVGLGEAAIIRKGTRKLAVYRDRMGAVYVCSAACPHLGGAVRWNQCEHTWDCPVHGSRFDVDGRVIHGPAGADLTTISHPDEATIEIDEERPVLDPTALAQPGLSREGGR